MAPMTDTGACPAPGRPPTRSGRPQVLVPPCQPHAAAIEAS